MNRHEVATVILVVVSILAILIIGLDKYQIARLHKNEEIKLQAEIDSLKMEQKKLKRSVVRRQRRFVQQQNKMLQQVLGRPDSPTD